MQQEHVISPQYVFALCSAGAYTARCALCNQSKQGKEKHQLSAGMIKSNSYVC